MPEWRGGYKAAQKRHRDKKRTIIALAKDRPCADCGGRFPACAMDFDHRDPSTKCFGIGPGNHSIPKLEAEIAKCDVVCANCHRIRTHASCRV